MAFALAAAAAPFVPEAIAAYAGYRYLRGFLYGMRQWHAPARVPLHLGKRGYRDASTGVRGTATWCIGGTISDKQQIWLRTEDFRQGCVYVGPEPTWLRQSAEAMTFGACLNQMGALIVDDWTTPSLSRRLGQIAAPFGRDAGLVTVDLTDPLSNTLRITAESIAGALSANGVSQATIDVVEALTPVLALIGKRYALDPLSLYPIYFREEALSKLAKGQYEINGSTVNTKEAKAADEQAFTDVNKSLARFKSNRLQEACRELEPFAHELAITRGLSISRGFDLRAALRVGRMTYIRPSSAWTRHIVLRTCTEALSLGELKDVLVHVVSLDTPNLGQLDMLRAVASEAHVIASFAVLDQTDMTSESDLVKNCALRFQSADVEAGTPHFIESKLKDCRFGLEYTPMRMPLEPGGSASVKPTQTVEEARTRAEREAKANAPVVQPVAAGQ